MLPFNNIICFSSFYRNYFNKIYFFLSSTRPPSLESVQTSASLTSAHASSSINPPSSALSDTEAEASSTKPLLADSNAGMYVGIPALLPHSDTRETSGQRPCQQQRRFCGALTPGGALVLRIFVASALVILNGLAIVAWIPALVFASVSPGHVFDEYEKAFVRILGCICIALAAFHMTMGLLFYQSGFRNTCPSEFIELAQCPSHINAGSFFLPRTSQSSRNQGM